MENATFVVLRLEGMLQSWGDHAKWDTRDSGDFPSKSGVVGLLACAMGLERGDPAIVALSDSISVAVRADRPGTRVLDFHTVQGRPRLHTVDGVRGLDQSTIISTRWYLQDASFLVLIEAERPLADQICAALRCPKWPIYLGRKSCVPSRPVLEGITTEYQDLMDALRRYPVEGDAEMLFYECELPQESGAAYNRADVLLPGERKFSLRQVYRGAFEREVRSVSDET